MTTRNGQLLPGATEWKWPTPMHREASTYWRRSLTMPTFRWAAIARTSRVVIDRFSAHSSTNEVDRLSDSQSRRHAFKLTTSCESPACSRIANLAGVLTLGQSETKRLNYRLAP